MRSSSSLDSSRLVSVPSIILCFAGAVTAACLDCPLPAGIMLFFVIAGICARLWAKHSADALSIELSCDRVCVFPGSELEFTYKITNGKLLPLIWLELSQDAPENGCVIPGNEFESYTYHHNSPDGNSIQKACRRSFSFIAAMEEVCFNSVWKAASRGIYAPGRLMLRSGDGFGLAILDTSLPECDLPVITVYPRIVPVDITPLLKFSQGQIPGNSGFFEDETFLRGIAPYEPADNWKHINWRMMARGAEELQVNRFEKLRPFSVLFILDGESFGPGSEGQRALEETIEIIASAAFEFKNKGFSCGLCLPKYGKNDSFIVAPQNETDIALILSLLAGYCPDNEREFAGDGAWTGQYKASEFDTGALTDASLVSGSVFAFTSGTGASPSMLRAVDRRKLTLYAYFPRDGASQLSTLSLRKGGAGI